ncbi:MAG: MFS transporter, partial [Fibrella sp.]|nr:MFS transporter [Armatimonadota bacterium]
MMVLSRLEVLRGLRISTWDAVYATVWMVLTTGAFQIGFARYLGASDFVLGLLAGLPAAVGLLQIPASLYSDRLASRKRFVAFNAVAGRLVWLLILAMPFFVPQALQVWVFVALLTVSSALLTIIGPAWTSWMSDLVPADFRGRYFGQRSMLAGIVTVLIPLPAGAFLDLAVKHQWFEVRWGFAVLFAIACVASVASFVMLLRQPEPPRIAPPGDRVNPFKALSAPLADRNFRAFITYSAAIVVSQTFAGQFFVAWQLDRDGLNMPYLTVQILGAVASGAGLATTQIWGYLSDKFGSRPLLQLATIATVVAPILWLFTIRGQFTYNVVLIVILNLVAGLAWAGVGLAQFNLLLSTAPAESRSTYVAVFSAITGIVGGVAPILGGIAMEVLKPVVLPFGIFSINNYKILFFITALIRICCVFLLSRVFEEHGRSTRYVLDQLISARPVSSFLRLRQLGRPAGEAEREQAIEQLAELRSPLAVEELVAALDDVSQAVRDSAVRALGEIGDARAVPALAAKMTDPVAGIGSLAAEALGRIGDREATPELNAAACGEDAEVRVAALKAIAQIGDPLSLAVIIGALDARHPTACEAACLAVSALAPELPPPDARALVRDYLLPLLAPDAPRGVRFAAARALRDVAKTGATPETAVLLLSRLASEGDPAVASRLAFALSRFG